MREILFKGKTPNGKWIEGLLMKHHPVASLLSKNCLPNQKQDEVDFQIVATKTLGEYTGLTDCNGKKIFEGDLVEMPRGGILPVEFWGGTFELAFGDVHMPLRDIADVSEVVGNIHDIEENETPDQT